MALNVDGHRLISVDETGKTLTGDQVLAIYARHLKSTGRLENNVVVSAVINNMGLGEALRKWVSKT